MAQLAQLQQVIASQQSTPEQQVALQLLLQQQAAQLMVAQQVGQGEKYSKWLKGSSTVCGSR